MQRQLLAVALLSILMSDLASADQAQTNCYRYSPQQIQCTTISTPTGPPPTIPAVKPVDIGAVMLQAEQIKALRAQREALERQQALQSRQLKSDQQHLEDAPLTQSEHRDAIRFRRYLDQLEGCTHQADAFGCVDATKASDVDFARIYAEQHAPGVTAYRGKVWRRAFADNMQTDVPESTVNGGDLYTDLIKLDELRKRGLLTDAEFDEQKKKLLGRQ